jgi:hypothetical protein
MTEVVYEKVSVTLPRALVESARRRAGERGFSAYVAEGLRMAEHMADLDEFLAAHQPVPAELMEEVRRAWPDPRPAAGRQGRRKAPTRSSSTRTG